MNAKIDPAHEEPEPRDRSRTYIAVVVLEACVIAALWLFQQHFGG